MENHFRWKSIAWFLLWNWFIFLYFTKISWNFMKFFVKYRNINQFLMFWQIITKCIFDQRMWKQTKPIFFSWNQSIYTKYSELIYLCTSVLFGLFFLKKQIFGFVEFLVKNCFLCLLVFAKLQKLCLKNGSKVSTKLRSAFLRRFHKISQIYTTGLDRNYWLLF